LRRAFSAGLSDLETFYLDEDKRRRLAGMGRIRRTVRRVIWLVGSLLLKLTPARRVMLAVALVFLMTHFQIDDRSRVIIGLQLPAFGAVLVIIVLMLELKDKLIAKNELVAGRAVQLALMPPESPPIAGWDIWLYTQPANDVGGDLVDHLSLGESRHAICLGDVAGKALPAALLMVKLQATLRALGPDCRTLDELGARTNHILFRDGLPNRFATLVYFILAAESGHLRYLNAGHLPPLLVRGERIEPIPTGSIALGMIETAEFHERTIELQPADTLVAFSDGVVEAADAADEFFGDDRLRAAIARVAGQPARQIGQAILEAVASFIGETRPYDDLSVIVLRRT
jgi:serine phosphatase RsbU (regulator of sigma subunit)